MVVALSVRGTAMNRAMLANDIAFSDLHPASHLGFESEILGRPADDGTMSDKIPGAEPDASFDDGVGLNHGVVSDYDLGSRRRRRDRSPLARRAGHLLPRSLSDEYSQHSCFFEAEVRRTTFGGRANDNVIEELDLKELGRLRQTPR